MNMSILRSWIWMLAAAALISGACGSKVSSKVDVRSFEAAFSTAKPEIKAVTERGVLAIKSADYRAGFAELAKLLKSEKLSAQQKNALETMLHQLSQLLPPQPALSPMGVPAKK
jgi:hypothetical protein